MHPNIWPLTTLQLPGALSSIISLVTLSVNSLPEDPKPKFRVRSERGCGWGIVSYSAPIPMKGKIFEGKREDYGVGRTRNFCESLYCPCCWWKIGHGYRSWACRFQNLKFARGFLESSDWNAVALINRLREKGFFSLACPCRTGSCVGGPGPDWLLRRSRLVVWLL